MLLPSYVTIEDKSGIYTNCFAYIIELSDNDNQPFIYFISLFYEVVANIFKEKCPKDCPAKQFHMFCYNNNNNLSIKFAAGAGSLVYNTFFLVKNITFPQYLGPFKVKGKPNWSSGTSEYLSSRKNFPQMKTIFLNFDTVKLIYCFNKRNISAFYL